MPKTTRLNRSSSFFTASEMAIMDSTKKEIVYDMGLTFEALGKRDEMLDAFKKIYEVDYGYRDVAHRVESAYGE